MTLLLEAKGLTKGFGGVQAFEDVDLEVHEGEIFGLIGPNGAGKSTIYNVLTGFLRATRGQVFLEGRLITGLRPHQISSLGIARVFQQSLLFGWVSVLENMLMGFENGRKVGLFRSFLRLPAARREEQAFRDEAERILDKVGLLPLKSELAMNLSHGHQRALNLALALASQPKLLLLDEPTTGMNPTETRDMIGHIKNLRDRGITIMVVEHDMKVIRGVCDRIAVLDHGMKICEGAPDEVLSNPAVCEAYLGKGTFDVA
jgi:branched-chain amino acid transport system ATP-binding protein